MAVLFQNVPEVQGQAQDSCSDSSTETLHPPMALQGLCSVHFQKVRPIPLSLFSSEVTEHLAKGH